MDCYSIKITKTTNIILCCLNSTYERVFLYFYSINSTRCGFLNFDFTILQHTAFKIVYRTAGNRLQVYLAIGEKCKGFQWSSLVKKFQKTLHFESKWKKGNHSCWVRQRRISSLRQQRSKHFFLKKIWRILWSNNFFVHRIHISQKIN